MPALTDTVSARLLGLLAGTYTAGGRYVSGVTFTNAGVWLPQQNPEWPDVVTDRTFVVQWSPSDVPLTFNDLPSDGVTNPLQGPHVRVIGARLSICYQIETPDALAPRDTPWALDPLDAVSRKATADAERLMWIFNYTPNWSGVAISCRALPSAGTRADRLRYVQPLVLRWQVSRSAVTAPDWGA